MVSPISPTGARSPVTQLTSSLPDHADHTSPPAHVDPAAPATTQQVERDTLTLRIDDRLAHVVSIVIQFGQRGHEDHHAVEWEREYEQRRPFRLLCQAGQDR
jgi:hypothetical protein